MQNEIKSRYVAMSCRARLFFESARPGRADQRFLARRFEAVLLGFDSWAMPRSTAVSAL
ncbi:MAG TPA: hypothetical protein VGX95_08880 [Xanthobacteraceae bacterium]|jgi:hypothetical protein|nr:hypothetical protein [Xanthobacteraceae bacterium]